MPEAATVDVAAPAEEAKALPEEIVQKEEDVEVEVPSYGEIDEPQVPNYG